MAEQMITRMDYNFSESGLYQFLGAEKGEQFKDKVIDLVLDHMDSDLRDAHYYLLCPEDVQDILIEIKEQLKEEIVKEFGKEIKEKLKAQIFAEIMKGE